MRMETYYQHTMWPGVKVGKVNVDSMLIWRGWSKIGGGATRTMAQLRPG